jgi:hypothetical protein
MNKPQQQHEPATGSRVTIRKHKTFSEKMTQYKAEKRHVLRSFSLPCPNCGLQTRTNPCEACTSWDVKFNTHLAPKGAQ